MTHKNQIEAQEKEIDDNYNEGLGHSYRYIMAIIEKKHPNLKIDELAVDVTEYINEQAAKEGEKEREPTVSG